MLYNVRENLLLGQTKLNLLGMVLLIMLIGVSVTFYTDMYVPTLPNITEFFGTNASYVQLSITGYLLAVAVSQLIYGPMSDRFGRRSILFLGLLVALVGSITCVKAGSIGTLVVGRLIQGSGIGTCLCLVRAIARDVFEGTRLAKVGSVMSMGTSIAASIAPIVGGYIATWLGWHANFEFLLCFSIGLFVLTWLFLPETLKEKNREATRPRFIAKNYMDLISNKNFMGYVVCTSMASAGLIGYFTMSPYIVQYMFGLSMIQYSYLAIMITIVIFSGRMLNMYLLSHFRLEQITGFGMLLMLVGSVMMILLGGIHTFNIAVLMLPMLVFCLGNAFVVSNGMAGALAPIKKMGGYAGAVFGGIQILGSFFVSAIAASLHHNSQYALGVILFCVAMVGLIVLYFTIIRHANGFKNYLSATTNVS